MTQLAAASACKLDALKPADNDVDDSDANVDSVSYKS